MMNEKEARYDLQQRLIPSVVPRTHRHPADGMKKAEAVRLGLFS